MLQSIDVQTLQLYGAWAICLILFAAISILFKELSRERRKTTEMLLTWHTETIQSLEKVVTACNAMTEAVKRCDMANRH